MDKKYSAKDAAIAVLEKAKEMYKSSNLAKAEKSKHDRCVEHVKENSPEVKNPHAVCVAEGVKPAKWSKSEAIDAQLKKFEKITKKENHEDAETMAMAEQDATPKDGVQPESKPEHMENGNPEWGTLPGTYKLAKFLGHLSQKKKSKGQQNG